ncbi:MAG: hypothetical protein ACP5US_10750 [Candidatus Kryptoniota bacterium]
MMNNKIMMEKVGKMPTGIYSASNKYWCVTCRLLFNIDKPICPYMPQMCINTPVPVEVSRPESTVSIEKFGLFYPKVPQKMMSFLAGNDPEEVGRKWAEAYILFLKEWRFEYKREPLQTLKSFIITISGSETAQRITSDGIVFVITDLQKVWDKEKLFPILKSAVTVLKADLEINDHIFFDEIDIIGEKETGKYYCSMCRKFFEFSSQKDSITCPLMPQKCVAVPHSLDKVKYSLKDLISVYSHTPDIYRRFMNVLPLKDGWREYLAALLEDEWKFEVMDRGLDCIASQIGLAEGDVTCLSEEDDEMKPMAMMG